MVKRGRDVSQREVREYQEAASLAVGSVEDKAHRKHLERVFKDPDSFGIYRDLREGGMSQEKAADMLRYGAVHYEANSKGEKTIRFDKVGVYHAIGDGVRRAGGHEAAIRAMIRDGYMDAEESGEYGHRIKKRVEEDLAWLAEAAVWIFMAIGVVLVLMSGFTMTGAVIGSAASLPWIFFVGLALFVMGLILKFKK